MTNQKTDNRTRKRGVRASRVKLTRALHRAGLKTQAALADHIADAENLDQPPKGLVNRAFRELPVEFRTIERIANALNTETSLLLINQDDENQARGMGDGFTGETHAYDYTDGTAGYSIKSRKNLTIAGLLLIAVLIPYYLFSSLAGKTPSEPSRVLRQVALPQVAGKYSLVISASNEIQTTITNLLRARLAEEFILASEFATSIAQTTHPENLAERLGADLVLRVDHLAAQNHQAILLYLYTMGKETLIWSEPYFSLGAEKKAESIAQNAARALRKLIENATLDEQEFANAETMLAYLKGRATLELYPDPKNIKLAEAHFATALRFDSNFGLAHTGMCEAMVRESWLGSTNQIMNEAKKYCRQGLALTQNHPYAALVDAYRQRTDGQLFASMDKTQAILHNHPETIHALAELGEARVQAYLSDSNINHLEDAADLAEQTIQLAPDFWRGYQTLGLTQFYTGDIDAALSSWERVVSIAPNEVVHSNLGTMHFCRGNFSEAENNYLKIQELNPDSYISHEFLGMVRYFNRDYALSAQLREIALQKINNEANLHQMWGGLGDSYRQLNNIEKASHAYLKAATIVEKDTLTGGGTTQEKLFRLYYLLQLQQLNTAAFDQQKLQAALAELPGYQDEIADSSGLVRLSQIYLLTGETEKAREQFTKAIAFCPGYKALPDLASLTTLQGH